MTATTPTPSPRATRRPLHSLVLMGPAFVAAIAYVDPGNVAANMSSGAEYGYLLIWVLVLASLMAMLVQYLSAKLGLVTGASLPQVLGQRYSAPTRRAYWVQAELIAMATDLAEVIGGAIALNLLFGLPLLWGGLIVGLISTLILMIQGGRRQRLFETVITALLLTITAGFLAGLIISPAPLRDVATGLVPRFDGTGSVLLAASMLGATVMPHAIYLHSALARDRHGRPTVQRLRETLRATKIDIGVALGLASIVNIGLLVVAAHSLYGLPGTDTIEGAHAAMTEQLGAAVGIIFGVGLLASGLASTSVGCYAGATIMEGLLLRRVPVLARRVLTMVPALVILAVGVEPTQALVMSQVVLSLGIPFALIPLLRVTDSASVMGALRNGPVVRVLAWGIAAVIVALNVALVVLTLADL
ncbi:Nramp family divalent metal transporter [Micrococcales bacterium 31B]|nr:Nramp family divalent metal transporter [Micrococcales bacterium 31B]